MSSEQAIWNRARIIDNRDKLLFRRDNKGHVMHRSGLDKTGNGGWVIKPKEEGSAKPSNLQAVSIKSISQTEN